jgi:hypothetical protein
MLVLMLLALLLAALNEASWVIYIASIASRSLRWAMLANTVIVVSGLLMTLMAVHDPIYLAPVLLGHGTGLYVCWPFIRRAPR